MSAVGDVNGDGLGDLIVGATPVSLSNGTRVPSKSYVVYGWTDLGTVTNSGHTFEVYNAANSSVMAQLLVDTMVTRSGITA